MKRYTFEVALDEGNDEFWDSIANRKGTKEVKALMEDMLGVHGFNTTKPYKNASVKLTKFEKL